MEVTGLEKIKYLSQLTYIALRRSRVSRQRNTVLNEYEPGWKSYSAILEKCDNLDAWLHVKGIEDQPFLCNVDGKMSFTNINMPDFNRRNLVHAMMHDFKNVQSVTEYGSGIGRNLLFIKKHYPHIQCYGYELCKNGVDIANRAKDKFSVDVHYSQLDFINDSNEKYIFPNTDIAFTMYALEQIPTQSKTALENILAHVKLGSIHIEPVIENYPLSFRGIIGRLDHWKIDYLRNFECNLREINGVTFTKKQLSSSHNPLMFPSLYCIKKANIHHDKNSR